MPERDALYLEVGGVSVEVDVLRFCSPDMRDVLEFYPKWRERGGAWSIQGYFCGFCKELEKFEREQGLPEKDRGARALQHFGAAGFSEMLEKYGKKDGEWL